ncbi:dolichol-phosphate mannosyltransferase [Nematocida minor]|uniref:dolichol-phosphate mannosyltransferase n=1 Tax=Nematocida minor TaxID=1912983 RepID=UPI0022202DA7|nr:dolichol-phosphate mannosyltransferase [Nematocida minor]XP_051332066.1 dolichol-phosphate mannosyltransferase [Nematocida minor]KAI5188796.1 dolichol-phosphate mannosyltransferase [Nematocida minor]KAI5188900.1 dolichol-phosphate mannosyltransferase [Nematocida minor]
MELSIIIPTHNEKSNAPLLMHLISKVLKGVAYEVIIVDDGSTDGTADLCSKVAEKTGIEAQILVRDRKMGLGNAYKRGVSHAKGSYIVILDADLSHDPREIPNLLRKIKDTQAGIVIGSRYREGGGTCNWPFLRKLTSQGANILAHIFTGKQNTDMTNSYRIYKKDIITYAIQNVQAQGFAYQMEILFHCSKKIEEIPIKFYERLSGRSKLSVNEYAQFLLWGSSLLAKRVKNSTQELLYSE